MGRKPYTNQVPTAPFSLIQSGPRTTTDIYNSLGMKRYLVSRGAETDPRATVESSQCPKCGAVVEWALTFKRQTNHPKGGECYVYSRCRGTDRHSWSFRNQGNTTDQPETQPVIPDKTPLVTPPSTNETLAAMEQVIEETQTQQNPAVDHDLGVLTGRVVKLETWSRDAAIPVLADLEKRLKKFEAQQPQVIEIKAPEFTARASGVRHPVLDELLERIGLGQRSFLLVGPAGTGKTTIGEQVREALKASGTTFTMSEDQRREAFVGHKGYDIQQGTTPFQETALCRDLDISAKEEKPFVVSIFEEIDGSNPNVLLTINTLENRFLVTADDPDRPRRNRGPNHVMIATANTFASAQTGSMAYVGRNQLDAATLSRYITLWVGYDPKVERAIVGDNEAVSLFENVRRKVDQYRLKRVACTRMARQLAQDRRLTKYKGKAIGVVLHDMLINKGWAADEIARVIGDTGPLGIPT